MKDDGNALLHTFAHSIRIYINLYTAFRLIVSRAVFHGNSKQPADLSLCKVSNRVWSGKRISTSKGVKKGRRRWDERIWNWRFVLGMELVSGIGILRMMRMVSIGKVEVRKDIFRKLDGR